MEYAILLGALENVIGKGHKKSRDNYAFHCPVCNHAKPKLEINLNTNEKGENPWECWVCGSEGTRGKTIHSLLKKINLPKEKAQDILQYVKKGKKYEYYVDVVVELPKEFQPIYKASGTSIIANTVKKYLYGRGLSDNDFIKYNIGYATTGDYGGRIIIPSYSESNRLNYFVARTYNRDNRKYNNPVVSKDIVFFENLINWNQPIILCEGVFDAIAIKRNSIPILGKSMSNCLVKQLLKSKSEDIYLALDKDAIKSSLIHAEKLITLGKKVYIVDMEEKDPSEMGFVKFTKHIQTAKELTLRRIMQYKLGDL